MLKNNGKQHCVSSQQIDLTLTYSKNQSNSCSIWPPLALTTACSRGLTGQRHNQTVSDSVQPSIAGSFLSGRLSWWCCPGKPSAAAHHTQHSPPSSYLGCSLATKLVWCRLVHSAAEIRSASDSRCPFYARKLSAEHRVEQCDTLSCVISRSLFFNFPQTFPSPWIIFLAADETGYELNVGLVSLWQSEVDHCLVYGTLTTSGQFSTATS